MRLFIAIPFEEEVLDLLFAHSQALRQQALGGNFSRRENLHITLAFLGEQPGPGQAVVAMQGLHAAPFVLRLAGCGAFARPGGDIWWMGLEKNPALENLHRQLQTALKQNGLPIEERPFKPHLTLGRQVRMSKDFDRGAFAARLRPIQTEVGKISLMRSERLNGKLTYTELYTKELQG